MPGSIAGQTRRLELADALMCREALRGIVNATWAHDCNLGLNTSANPRIYVGRHTALVRNTRGIENRACSGMSIPRSRHQPKEKAAENKYPRCRELLATSTGLADGTTPRDTSRYRVDTLHTRATYSASVSPAVSRVHVSESLQSRPTPFSGKKSKPSNEPRASTPHDQADALSGRRSSGSPPHSRLCLTSRENV